MNVVTAPSITAPSLTHRWKKLMAVGCSHGDLAKPEALRAVLDFKERWKPDWTAHLGDAFDCTAFRSGAAGTKDESKAVRPDATSGKAFLKALRPDLFCLGNHEARLWSLQYHPKAIVSELAASLVKEIEVLVEGWGGTIIPYNVLEGWHEHAGYKYLHGFMYNELACRDHAETFGNCVFAHTHQAGMAKGRRSDNPTGYCVGTLTSIPNMDYAMQRRKTLAWCAGFVWGEYHDDTSVIWVHQQPLGETEWRLPL